MPAKRKRAPAKRESVTVELDLAGLTAKLQAQLAIAHELMTAVTAAEAALRKLTALLDGPTSAPVTMPGAPRLTTSPPVPPRNKDLKRVPVKKHICAHCEQTTTWDPCDNCGKAAPVMASLMGRAPTTTTADEEE